MVGLQMISGLPQQVADLKKSLALVKTGADANVRAAAAADFSTKLQGIMTFMNTNFHSPLLAKKKGVS
jgi:4-aminobutyrate aminotransferase-like enzyme